MAQSSDSSNADLKSVEESSKSSLQNVNDKEVSEDSNKNVGEEAKVVDEKSSDKVVEEDIGKSDGAIKNVGEEKQEETNKVTDGDQSGDKVADTDAAKVEATEDNGKDPKVGEEPKPGSGALDGLKSKISGTVAKIGESTWFAMLQERIRTVMEYLRSLFRLNRNSSGRE